MKVIQQLIGYFNQRGKLSPRQIDELVERGYWKLYNSGDMHQLENRFGESFFFEATGAEHGPLWGTDVYTTDSSVDVAAVHAGLLESGQSGVLKVTIVQPPPVFHGSQRNGITSSTWNNGWPSAFQMELVSK